MSLTRLDSLSLFSHFDPRTGVIEGAPSSSRYLSDLEGCFADSAAFEERVREENPVIYTVSSIAPANGDGQLHYGLGVLAPGRIGCEYFMTRGHFHAWRPAAEVYVGLCGVGAMLLVDVLTGESRLVPLVADSIVYVPGHTAHRTINTGDTPLTYIGIYPAAAGHDYGSIAVQNFRKVVAAVDGKPTLLDRADYARLCA